MRQTGVHAARILKPSVCQPVAMVVLSHTAHCQLGCALQQQQGYDITEQVP
jgi:hypothetical protein